MRYGGRFKVPVFNLSPVAPMFDSIGINLITEALHKAEQDTWKKFTQRRRECLQYYRNEILIEDGGSEDYLKNYFRTYNAEKARWDEPKRYLLEHLPVTEQLIDLKSRVYSVQPERKIKSESGEVVDAEEYTNLLKRSGWFSMSKEVERHTQLLRDIAVGVFLSEDKKTLRFVLVTEYVPTFDPNDPEQINPTGICYPTAIRETDGSVRWVFYDKEKVVWLDGNKNVINSEPNTFGVFNFIFPHRRKPVDSHFGLPRVELVAANRAVDVAVTGLNDLLRRNGFKQLVIIGNTGDDVKEFQLGNNTVLVIKPEFGEGSASPSASVLDMQADFEGYANAIKFKMEAAAQTMNMTVNWSMEVGGVSSGRALQIKNVRDFEDRTGQIEVIDELVEQPLYEIVKSISGKFGLKVEKGELVADFPEQDSGFQSVSDEIAWENHQLETNRESQLTLMMRDNPDMSEEEAIKKLNDNAKLNRAFRGGGGLSEDSIRAILEDKDIEPGDGNQNPLGEETDAAGQGEGGIRDLAQ